MKYASLFDIPLTRVGFTEAALQLSDRQIKPSAELVHFGIAAIIFSGIAHEMFFRHAEQGIQ